jgi:hypothetical protein
MEAGRSQARSRFPGTAGRAAGRSFSDNAAPGRNGGVREGLVNVRTWTKGVLVLVAGLVASGAVPARAADLPGGAGPAVNACGDRAAVLGDVSGGCASVLTGSPDYVAGMPDGRAASRPSGDLPQLPVDAAALPSGALPVSLGATPALPRLESREGAAALDALPGMLPGALPRVRVKRAPPPERSLPGLPSIPVVRPVPSPRAAHQVKEPPSARPLVQFGVLALGGLLAASAGVTSVIRRR